MLALLDLPCQHSTRAYWTLPPRSQPQPLDLCGASMGEGLTAARADRGQEPGGGVQGLPPPPTRAHVLPGPGIPLQPRPGQEPLAADLGGTHSLRSVWEPRGMAWMRPGFQIYVFSA